MSLKEHQFSVQYVALAITALAAYLSIARILVGPSMMVVGIVLLLFWFALVFFLLTCPPEIAPRRHNLPTQRLSFRWRLAAAGVAAMTISLLAMMWALRTS